VREKISFFLQTKAYASGHRSEINHATFHNRVILPSQLSLSLSLSLIHSLVSSYTSRESNRNRLSCDENFSFFRFFFLFILFHRRKESSDSGLYIYVKYLIIGVIHTKIRENKNLLNSLHVSERMKNIKKFWAVGKRNFKSIEAIKQSIGYS
jgi:hypothetical protein